MHAHIYALYLWLKSKHAVGFITGSYRYGIGDIGSISTLYRVLVFSLFGDIFKVRNTTRHFQERSMIQGFWLAETVGSANQKAWIPTLSPAPYSWKPVQGLTSDIFSQPKNISYTSTYIIRGMHVCVPPRALQLHNARTGPSSFQSNYGCRQRGWRLLLKPSVTLARGRGY